MDNRTVHIDGETIVVGDLHLQARPSRDDDLVWEWIEALVAGRATDWLVLNGDTFGLSTIDHSAEAVLLELRSILNSHGQRLCAIVSGHVRRGVVLLLGEHDFRLAEHDECLDEFKLMSMPIILGQAAFHEASLT